MYKLCITFVLFHLSLFSQEDYTLYYKRLYFADNLAKKGNNEAALKIYDSLSSNFKYSIDASYLAGVRYFKKGNYLKASNHFLKLASMGEEYRDLPSSNLPNCPFCFSENELEILNEKVPGFRFKYLTLLAKAFSGFNLEFNEILKEMLIKEQQARQDLILSENDQSYGVAKKARIDKMNQIDSLNLLELKRLIKLYATYPSLGIVSPKALHAFGMIITHNSTENWAYNYCDSLLKGVRKRFKTGTCLSPEIFANIIDRRYHHLKNVNFYCKFYDKDYPIFEPENIDLRRGEIYLLPLKEVNDKIKY